MFRWYRDARVCYVYLIEMPSGFLPEQHDKSDLSFRRSAWFSRRWTLKELLAPELVIFYEQKWNELGTKLS